MAVVDVYPDPSTLTFYGGSTNISESGGKFDFSSFNSNVQGGQPLSCQYLRTDGSYDYCQLSYYYKQGSYWRGVSGQYGFGNTFVDTFNSTFGYSLPYAPNTSMTLSAKLDRSTFSLIEFVWRYVPNDSSDHQMSQYHSVSMIQSDSGSGGSDDETVSDFSGIISAIYLIPATIIMIFFFKMIFNVFMNRKVRG